MSCAMCLKEPLLSKDDVGNPKPWWHKRVAYCLPLLYLVMVAFGLTLQISDDAQQRDDGILFAFVLQVLAFGWWYVLDTVVWRRNVPAIPYAKVLSYDEKPPPATPLELTAMVGAMTLTLACGMLVYLGVGRQGSIAIHLVVWLLGLAFLFAPPYVPLYPSRRRLVRTCAECFQASAGCCGRACGACGGLSPPVSPGGGSSQWFLLTWVTDQWTSACLMLWQMEYSLCCFGVTIGGVAGPDERTLGRWSLRGANECGDGSWNERLMKPIMYELPFVLRLLQEWRNRNWPNVGKYLSCVVLVLASTMHAEQQHLGRASVGDGDGAYAWDPWRAVWLVAVVVKTTYCYVWDIMRDWGLWQRGTTPPLLRPTRLYRRTWVYYAAMVTNFIGRVAWSLAISPHVLPPRWHLLLALIEISRRGQWSIFRLENQTISTAALEAPPGIQQQHGEGDSADGTELVRDKLGCTLHHDGAEDGAESVHSQQHQTSDTQQ